MDRCTDMSAPLHASDPGAWSSSVRCRFACCFQPPSARDCFSTVWRTHAVCGGDVRSSSCVCDVSPCGTSLSLFFTRKARFQAICHFIRSTSLYALKSSMSWRRDKNTALTRTVRKKKHFTLISTIYNISTFINVYLSGRCSLIPPSVRI